MDATFRNLFSFHPNNKEKLQLRFRCYIQAFAPNFPKQNNLFANLNDFSYLVLKLNALIDISSGLRLDRFQGPTESQAKPAVKRSKPVSLLLSCNATNCLPASQQLRGSCEAGFCLCFVK
jgi:hypothetical protein